MADRTDILIDFPDPPKVSERPEKHQDFERWYESFKTVITRQFEELAEKIDQKQNAT